MSAETPAAAMMFLRIITLSPENVLDIKFREVDG
jgi:hypothetical protein